jgi:hypothetical protein
VKLEDFLRRSIDRRTAMKAGTATFLASQMALFEGLAWAPQRIALASSTPSDIQFDIGAFVHPAQTFNDGAGNVVADFGVTFTMIAPARLTRTPSHFDQAVLDEALETIEANFPFSPAGAFVFTMYGLPYFNRLPQGLVRATMPRLLSDNTRFVLEESPVFPSDVSPQNPNIVKDRFNVAVTIETNDIVFEMRSDNLNNLSNILAWLQGSNNLNGNIVDSPDFFGLFNFDTPRVLFVQPGLPRKVADNAFANFSQGNLLYEFHGRINPDSSMVMGFVDQQVDSSAPSAQVVTFVGSSHAVLTTAKAGDYFDNGAIAHVSHDIDDLFQFYATPNQDSRRPDGEPFTERVQYMFRSNQINSGFFGLPTLNAGNADQFTNGGGAAFVNNVFQGAGAALAAAQDKDGKTTAQTNQDINATFTGTPRVGHEEALQRSSRAADGTPLHIRNDGPGFDTLDVPAFQDFPSGTNFAAGTTQFKLHFLAFVPTAEFFRQMRVNAAAQDFQAQFLGGQDDDNGLERFITATRRQNFLCPPRRHRAFPLVEFT